MDNNMGMHLRQSPNNSIYSNNFVNNNIQIFVDAESANDWNITIAGKGNYWSDYIGTDNDGDGFGDTLYIIEANNQDNYPLMNQFIVPELPNWIILPLFLITTLVVVIIRKKMLYMTT